MLLNVLHLVVAALGNHVGPLATAAPLSQSVDFRARYATISNFCRANNATGLSAVQYGVLRLVTLVLAELVFDDEAGLFKGNRHAAWRCNFFRDNQSWLAIAEENSTVTYTHFCRRWLQRCPEVVHRLITQSARSRPDALGQNSSLSSTETAVTIFPKAATLKIPEAHVVLTKPLVVEIRLYSESCIERTLLKTFSDISLQLLRLTKDHMHFTHSQEFVTVHSVRMTLVENASQLATLDCHLFDREALYKVQLSGITTTVANASSFAIAASNVMNTTWSPVYEVKMPNDRIFPCPVSGIAVSFTKPSCVTDRHRIRLYAVVPKKYYTVHIVPETVYVAERKIRHNQAVVHFDCDDFDLIYPEYCFTYVTVLDDGAVDEHSTQCVPTERKKCKYVRRIS
ncbi:unnamed protein product [Soboliphyme baturini]|uniref:Secreted protein n=1 Tax=Soboliphyme baturini TaxID=241478 RepID=A0A183IVL5_9BILA|nr:unnamed protein product [Soboliphyme baturini]